MPGHDFAAHGSWNLLGEAGGLGRTPSFVSKTVTVGVFEFEITHCAVFGGFRVFVFYLEHRRKSQKSFSEVSKVVNFFLSKEFFP